MPQEESVDRQAVLLLCLAASDMQPTRSFCECCCASFCRCCLTLIMLLQQCNIFSDLSEIARAEFGPHGGLFVSDDLHGLVDGDARVLGVLLVCAGVERAYRLLAVDAEEAAAVVRVARAHRGAAARARALGLGLRCRVRRLLGQLHRHVRCHELESMHHVRVHLAQVDPALVAVDGCRRRALVAHGHAAAVASAAACAVAFAHGHTDGVGAQRRVCAAARHGWEGGWSGKSWW